MAHGVYHWFGPEPDAACDMWRVNGDKIVEHWDGHQPWTAMNAVGRSGAVMEALVPTVLAQKVIGAEASFAYRAMVRSARRPAPWRGRRGRVCRLLLSGAPRPPRYGPRSPIRKLASQ